jgi:hypothetical protein
MNAINHIYLDDRKGLLLVGSPKGKASTSHVLGTALLKRLEAGGMETEEITILEGLRSPEARDRLLKAMDSASLVIVSFPLYVDALPAPLVQVLELVAQSQKPAAAVHPSAGTRPKIASLVQCGFPETFQNRPALDIMRKFAAEAGYDWAGGLAMGMGGAVARNPLDKATGMARNVVKALDLAAVALLAGNAIPEEAVTLMGKPLMPKWIYLFAANFGMKSQAKKHGVRKAMYAKPYKSL